MKRIRALKTQAGTFPSGLRHKSGYRRGGRIHSRSLNGSTMKTPQVELRATPQFDSGRWKLRLELVPFFCSSGN